MMEKWKLFYESARGQFLIHVARTSEGSEVLVRVATNLRISVCVNQRLIKKNLLVACDFYKAFFQVLELLEKITNFVNKFFLSLIKLLKLFRLFLNSQILRKKQQETFVASFFLSFPSNQVSIAFLMFFIYQVNNIFYNNIHFQKQYFTT